MLVVGKLERWMSCRLRKTPRRRGCWDARLRGLVGKLNGPFSSGPSGRTDLAAMGFLGLLEVENAEYWKLTICSNECIWET